MDVNAQTALLTIIAAHLTADCVLQGGADLAAKRPFRLAPFLEHPAPHAIGAYAFAGLWSLWQIPAVVFVSHPIVDGLKEASLRWLAPRDAEGQPVTPWKFWTTVFDQLLHLAVLVATIELLWRHGDIPAEPYWCALLGQHLWVKALVFLSGAVLAISVGGVLVGILVQPMLQEIRRTHPTHPSNTIRAEQRGLEKGGRFIGQLERALILLFVLSSQPTGVGFLIAAKSIFRFGELKDHKTRMEAEYIIIGTMLSFTWALMVAWATQWALSTI